MALATGIASSLAFFLAKKYFWKAYSTNMIQYMINYIIFSIHAIWFSSNLLFWKLAVERVPEFSGTQAEPNLIKQNIKFGVKSARYPTKYPTFSLPESDILEFPPDPNPTFYYPIYSVLDFLLPSPPLDFHSWKNTIK